jgi:hypothetical protein
MFSRKIANDHTHALTCHNAVHFNTELPQKQVTELLLKMGVAAFLTPDDPEEYKKFNGKPYKDSRIQGAPSFRNRAGCCAFTKDPNQWYLFPIHADALANTGLTEEDLVYWIKFLNDMRVGFKYLYLGAQEGNARCQEAWVQRGTSFCFSTNTAYWVAVPKFAVNTDAKKPYLHWIALRYLINTSASASNMILTTMVIPR